MTNIFDRIRVYKICGIARNFMQNIYITCEKLRAMSIAKITASKKQGVALKNEMANYTNSLRSIRDVLLDNENYTKCPLYKRLQRDIEKYIARTIWNMKRSGAIRDDSTWTVLRNMRQGSEIK